MQCFPMASPTTNQLATIKTLQNYKQMTVTNEDQGRQNIWAKEPQMEVMDVTVTHNEKAEMLNGRVAMMGIIAALGAYATTGQIIPGLW